MSNPESVGSSSGGGYQFIPSGEGLNIDPRYQYLKHKKENGLGLPSFKTADRGSVPVIGKIQLIGIDQWKELSEVQPGVEIKYKEKYWLVTGRVPFKRFEFVRSRDYVMSLKIAQPVRPLLKETVENLGLSSPHDRITQAVLDQGGKGVFVGIVDYGCDFNHNHFKKPNGKTRIVSLWDQGQSVSPNSPFGYGRAYTATQIDQALRTENPYRTLGYSGVQGEDHGTHVMDIAAGSDADRPGVAPKANIVFVELSSERMRGRDDILDKDFGDSVRVVEAVKYIFDQAGENPCVVNLSLGTNGGPHDGTNHVEKSFDALVRERPNRAIVVAAANAYSDKIHQSGKLAAGERVDLRWEIQPSDPTYNEMEIWYSSGDEFGFEIVTPNRTFSARIPLGQNGGIWDNNRNLLAYVSHRKNDPNNGDNVIHIFQDPAYSSSGGIWTLRLEGRIVQPAKGGFHAWIERDDAGQSKFGGTDDPNYTIGSISTGKETITVGSYDAHKLSNPISYFSSAGPTRDGRFKPEVSAPGHQVLAALSGTVSGFIRMSGTSMAAPAVTGLVARILGYAREKNLSLTIDQIRKALISTCRLLPPSSPDNRYGYGRVSADAIIAAFDSPSLSLPGTLRTIEEDSRALIEPTSASSSSSSIDHGSVLVGGVEPGISMSSSIV